MLKLRIDQTAEKLGVTREAVIRYRDQGRLTDTKTRPPGKKKHYSEFDEGQVDVLKKQLALEAKQRQKDAALSLPLSPNGHGAPAGPDRFQRIETSLQELHAKMDKILGWVTG